MLNWIRRPKYDAVARRDLPPGLWEKCPRCAALVYHKELERNLRVCPRCHYHHRLSARDRLRLVLDDGSFEESDAALTPEDPLDFVDEQPYTVRLEEAQRRTGLCEAIITGTGTVEGRRTVIGAMEFAFLGGSMGAVVGEAITRAIERACEHNKPIIVISASGGARMMEGVVSLMQMAKISAALARLDSARVPYISVLTDPTTGGVTASYAMLGDLNIAEPGALIGFAGKRTIKNTVRLELPEGFQTSEFLFKHGFVDRIVHRKDLRTEIARIIDLCER